MEEAFHAGGQGWQSGRRPCCTAAIEVSMAGRDLRLGGGGGGAPLSEGGGCVQMGALMVANLASCLDPSRYGLSRPEARGGTVRGGWRLPAIVPTTALVSMVRLGSTPPSWEIGVIRFQ